MSDDLGDLLARRSTSDRIRRLLLELLGVLDGLDRLCAAESANEAAALVRLELAQVLERQGVVPLETLSLPFDPYRHEAVERRWVEGVAAGIVVAECGRGYLWQGELLRPARVLVASESPGGPS